LHRGDRFVDEALRLRPGQRRGVRLRLLVLVFGSGGEARALVPMTAGATGPRTPVAGLVAAVTNPPHEPGRDRHQQDRAHVAASLEASPWGQRFAAIGVAPNCLPDTPT
jgi:hypothetical protein